MFNNINLANMVFDGISRSISITPKACSKIKHKASPCTICYTACPVEAINIGGPGQTIEVDWDKCTGCGICVSQCPSQVFKLRHGGYKKYIENMCKSIDARGSLKLVCGEYSGFNAKSAVLDCIGMLTSIDILVLYLKGASNIEIRYGNCSDCESKHGKAVLDIEMKNLEQLSQIFEDLNDLEIVYESDGVKLKFSKQYEIERPKEEEKQNPEVNRRGMFSFLGKQLKDAALKSADMLTAQQVDNRTSIEFTHEITAKRQIFLDTIMELGKITKREVNTGMLFNNILIDESCIYCGMCARFCGTGALTINDGRTEMYFNASKCISCGLCEKACYHDKLHYLPTLDLKYFFQDRVLVTRNPNGPQYITDMINIDL